MSDIQLEKTVAATDHGPQRNPIAIACVLLLILVLIPGFLVQLWIRPEIEQQVTFLVKENFRQNGFRCTGEDPRCTVSPLSREITIAPCSLTPEPGTDAENTVRRIDYGRTVVSCTLKGLLAFSPLAGLVLSGDDLSLSDSVSTGTVDILTAANEKISLSDIEVHDITVSADSMRTMLRTGELPADGFRIGAGSAGAVQLLHDQKKEPVLSTGRIDFSQLTAQTLDDFRIHSIVLTDNDTTDGNAGKDRDTLTIGTLSIRRIHAPTQKELLDLTENLTQASEDEVLEHLSDLFFRKDPILQELALKDIHGSIDSSRVQIAQIAFQAHPEGIRHRLTLDGIAIPGQYFRDVFGRSLPVPEMLHADFSSELADQDGPGKKTISYRLNIEELVCLESSVSADMKDLQNFIENLPDIPVHAISVRVEDRSLLARAAMVLLSTDAPTEPLLNLLREQPGSSPEEKELLEKIAVFVRHPGTFLIRSRSGEPFTFSGLADLSEQDLLRTFVIDVQPGQRTLDEQAALLRED